MRLCGITWFLSVLLGVFLSSQLVSAATADKPDYGKGPYSLDVSADSGQAYFGRLRRKAEGWRSALTCDVCYVFVDAVKGLVNSHEVDEVIISAVIDICIFFKIQDDTVCKLIVQEYKDEILFMARHLALEPRQACGILLASPCSGHYYPGENWTIAFPRTPKPEPKPPTPPKPSAPTLRVLHLTDLHLDLHYREGSKVFCGEPVCCRDVDGPGTRPDDKAGKFGQYGHCDIPSTTVRSLFEHLNSKKETFDYVLFTGDIPAHDVWNQTRYDQLRHLHLLDRMFQTYLPGVPVYWAVGNHEAAPCNSFVIPGLPGRNMSWLYEPLAKVWGRWLPKSALSTVRSCAGYSVSPYKGFRIISINNNYCNTDNLWILLNTTDPCGTLQFLVTELQRAEDHKEKVHILMHIPPGESACMKVWSHNFYNIINRYENTVVNQFYGHNHRDWFQMFYDTADFQRPLGFGFVTPALTSRNNINPVYRVYTIDGNYKGSSYAVLDYTNYYLDLGRSNVKGHAFWEQAYNPKTDLGMKSLYPRDWEDLIQRMETDDHLFRKFYLYYNNMHVEKECDTECKESLLCDLKEGRSYDPDLCKKHT